MEILQYLPAEILLPIIATAENKNILPLFARQLNEKPYSYWQRVSLNRRELLILARTGCHEIIKYVLTNQAIDVTFNQNQLFRWTAERYANVPMLKCLLASPRIDPTSRATFRKVCRKGRVEVLKVLLADVRVFVAMAKEDPLTDAVVCSKLEIVELLLAQNIFEFNGNDLLEIAIKRGHMEITQLLLADPRVSILFNGRNLLRIAIQYGSTLDILKMLVKDPRVDPDGYTLITAIRCEQPCVAKLLLTDPRVDPRVNNYSALRIAVGRDEVEIVKLLLDDPRVDPSYFNNAALKSAVSLMHTDCIILLLNDPRVDPSVDDNAALKYIVSQHFKFPLSNNKKFAYIKQLLADPRVDPGAAIGTAIKGWHLDELAVLVEHQLNANILSRLTASVIKHRSIIYGIFFLAALYFVYLAFPVQFMFVICNGFILCIFVSCQYIIDLHIASLATTIHLIYSSNITQLRKILSIY